MYWHQQKVFGHLWFYTQTTQVWTSIALPQSYQLKKLRHHFKENILNFNICEVRSFSFTCTKGIGVLPLVPI